MNLRQLSYFRAVVERGTLAAAADVLHIAQPNLSVAIRQLEAEWGVTLFDRIGRGLVLTQTGQILYDRSSELLGSADAIGEEMRAIGKGASVRIRAGFTATSLGIITRMVTDTAEARQGATFSLLQGEPRLLETLTEQRQLDFAITHLPVENPALHVHALAAPRLMLLVRRDDMRWHELREIGMLQLVGVPLLLLKRSEGRGIYQRIEAAFEALGISSLILADCSDMTALQALVISGAGVALLPLLDQQGLPEELLALPLSDAPEIDRLGVIYPRGKRLLPAVQAAMELCR